MKTSDFERRIRVAAFHFAEGCRDAKRLSELAGISVRSLYRVATETSHRLYPLWHSELAAMGYRGDLGFRVKPRGRQVSEEKEKQSREGWHSLKRRYPGMARRAMARELARELGETESAMIARIRRFEKEDGRG